MAPIREARQRLRDVPGFLTFWTASTVSGFGSHVTTLAIQVLIVVAFVTYGKVKLANLRARPQVTTTFRHGWNWVTVEGHTQLAGPDDAPPWLDAEGLRLLLRAVFVAAGGQHDDWDEYDRVMAEQRRTVALVEPRRVYSN